MTNNTNFFEVVTRWSQDEVSWLNQVEQPIYMDLCSFQEEQAQVFTIQKEYSIFDVQRFLAFNGVLKLERMDHRTQLFPSAQLPKNNCEIITSKRQRRQAKNISNSPFHNYQKHLSNALKTLVVVQESGNEDSEYKQAARCIWNKFCLMEIKTKRVLHFFFNQWKQQSINDAQLKNYGMLEIYRHYGGEVINKAKDYLSKLTIDQIDEASIEDYLKTRKIKKVEGLKSYILNFRYELEMGCIKKRMTIQYTQ